MKLVDLREAYQELSAKVSEIVRQLSLAAIAVIWIFKYDTNGKPQLPPELSTPLWLAIAALILDFLQYLYSSTAFSILHRRKECKGVSEDEIFKINSKINWPTNIFYWGKAGMLAISYIYILRYILNY